MVRLAGIEPATRGLENLCSIQLSYRRTSTYDGVREHCGDTGLQNANRSPLLFRCKVGVAHRHLDFLVTRKFLHGSYIYTSRHQTRDESVTQRVEHHVPAQSGFVTRLPEGFIVAGGDLTLISVSSHRQANLRTLILKCRHALFFGLQDIGIRLHRAKTEDSCIFRARGLFAFWSGKRGNQGGV